jgi:hypothetical protein
MALRGSATAINNAGGTSVMSVTVSGIGGVGPQANDNVLLIAAAQPVVTLTTPSGFALLGNEGMNGSAWPFSVYWKLAGAGEPSSYSVTASSNCVGNLVCIVSTGRSTAQPTNIVLTADNFVNFTGSNLPMSLTGLTAVLHDDVICVFYNLEGGANSFTYTTPTGFSNPGSVVDTSGVATECLFFAYDANVSAGATGAISTTATQTGAETGEHVGGVVISLGVNLGNTASIAWIT